VKNLNVKTPSKDFVPEDVPKRPVTSPPALSDRPRRPPPTGTKHDDMCVTTYQAAHALNLVLHRGTKRESIIVQVEEDVPRLSQCYCMRACCWQQTRVGGRCICRDCPCWHTRLASSPRTPRAPGGIWLR
jgi:hypothetical protein